MEEPDSRTMEHLLVPPGSSPRIGLSRWEPRSGRLET